VVDSAVVGVASRATSGGGVSSLALLGHAVTDHAGRDAVGDLLRLGGDPDDDLLARSGGIGRAVSAFLNLGLRG